MKRVFLLRAFILCALLAGSALNSLAGHGTIRETETQIIVEYSGDAVEEKPEAVQNQPQNSGDQPPQQVIEKKNEEEKPIDARRQKKESRSAQRAAQRKQEKERRQMEGSIPAKAGVDD